jgi:hypothetical protein
VPGWTRPELRDPAAADRWTWLILACSARLRLARDLAAGIRPPWQRPCQPAWTWGFSVAVRRKVTASTAA